MQDRMGDLGKSAHMHSTSFLSTPSPLKLALVLLNIDGGVDTDRLSLGGLWSMANLRICADGAANRLHDSLGHNERSQMLPDVISGDLDSLRGDVADYYREHGVSIEHQADQDSHDFEKCLMWLRQRQAEDGIRFSVVAYGAFGGRLDHMMANMNMVYKYSCFERFILLTRHSLAFQLKPGMNIIEPNLDVENGSCGLIPLGGRCEGVITTGLRWNLDGTVPLEFGSLVSSSNRIVGDQVTVQTDTPLLWTSNFVTSSEKSV